MKLREKLARREREIASQAVTTLVALGDSVTQGCFELEAAEQGGFDTVVDYDAVYHERLRSMLQYVFPRAPISVINAGVGGESAPMGLERLERDVLARSPDLVTVCFGLNDASGGMEHLEAYIHALGSIFAALQERDIECVFVSPNMMNTYVSPLLSPDSARDLARHTAQIQTGGTMDSFISAALSLSAEMGVPVCDVYGKWKTLAGAGVDTTRLLSNHINHPTREMHWLFASALFETIMGMTPGPAAPPDRAA